jgi:hypothetical protein
MVKNAVVQCYKLLKVLNVVICRVKYQHYTWIYSREYVTSVVVLELKEQRTISDTYNYKIIRCSKHIYNEPQCMSQLIYMHIT